VKLATPLLLVATVALAGLPHAIRAQAPPAARDKSIEARILPNMAPMAGAVPLTAGGRVIGAIGVSGASSLQDEKCAAAGAEKIQSRLNSSSAPTSSHPG
jgi:uncharacterized protein GlcG (DUF336 family)